MKANIQSLAGRLPQRESTRYTDTLSGQTCQPERFSQGHALPGGRCKRPDIDTVCPQQAPATMVPMARFWQAGGPPEYYTAAVCLRGHVEASSLELRTSPIPEHCDQCGALIIPACPICQKPIRGNPSGVLALYDPPNFCSCGSPFPWAPDQAIAFHIENLLAADNLPDAERRDLNKKLKVLLNRDEEPKKRAAALNAFKLTAPNAYALADVALRAFITADIQSHLK